MSNPHIKTKSVDINFSEKFFVNNHLYIEILHFGLFIYLYFCDILLNIYLIVQNHLIF